MAQSTCNKYDILAQQLQEQGKNLCRLFRVGHPAALFPVNIEIEEELPTYHILEQYMDRLLCGNSSDPTGHVLIHSKEELFALLGIDHEAYEIAQIFFEDLRSNGHFQEMPDGALKPLSPAYRSVGTLINSSDHEDSEVISKTARKFTSKTISQKMIFDQFSCELMPSNFYELLSHAVDPATVSAQDANRFIWLECNPLLLDTTVSFDMALKHTDYQGEKGIARGLPQGRTHITLSPDAKPQIQYFPYHLAVLRDGDDFRFEAYDYRQLTPIPWLTEMYHTDCYRSARERILAICNGDEAIYLRNPLCADFPLRLFGNITIGSGINCLAKTNNYIWTMQEYQVEYLTRHCYTPQDQNDLLTLVHNPVAVLNVREPGRTVTVILTPEQKAALLQAAEGPLKKNPEMASLRKRYSEAMLRFGVKKDTQTCLETLMQIADRWAPAAFLLGYMYLHGSGFVSKDEEAAYRYLRMATEQNYQLANLQLASLLLRKNSLRYNKKEAVDLLRTAANSKNSSAAFLYAYMIEKGDKEGKYRRQIMDYYISAAQQELVAAMVKVVQLYNPILDAHIDPALIQSFRKKQSLYVLPNLLETLGSS